MFNLEFLVQVKKAQYRDYLATAERDHLAAQLREPGLVLARRAARPLGHALLRLGASLLRYGRIESTVTIPDQRPAASSARLN